MMRKVEYFYAIKNFHFFLGNPSLTLGCGFPVLNTILNLAELQSIMFFLFLPIGPSGFALAFAGPF